MTNIEMDVARSTIRMNNAVTDHLQEIDWEQRRYEIAKEILPYCYETSHSILVSGHSLGDDTRGKTLAEVCASSAVAFADALIEELKKQQTQK